MDCMAIVLPGVENSPQVQTLGLIEVRGFVWDVSGNRGDSPNSTLRQKLAPLVQARPPEGVLAGEFFLKRVVAALQQGN